MSTLSLRICACRRARHCTLRHSSTVSDCDVLVTGHHVPPLLSKHDVSIRLRCPVVPSKKAAASPWQTRSSWPSCELPPNLNGSVSSNDCIRARNSIVPHGFKLVTSSTAIRAPQALGQIMRCRCRTRARERNRQRCTSRRSAPKPAARLSAGHWQKPRCLEVSFRALRVCIVGCAGPASLLAAKGKRWASFFSCYHSAWPSRTRERVANTGTRALSCTALGKHTQCPSPQLAPRTFTSDTGLSQQQHTVHAGQRSIRDFPCVLQFFR